MWRRIDPRSVEGIRVPGDGPRPAKLLIVGERPGINEPKAGHPFIGMAGQELDRYLQLSGHRRSDCFVTNLVKDYRDEDPEEWEIMRDSEELNEEIRSVSPQLIVPVGRFAIRHFLGDVDVEQVHGLLHLTDDWGPVYPCFHPAAGLHSPDSIQFIHSDFVGLRDPWGRLCPIDTDPPNYLGYWPPIHSLPLSIDTEGLRGSPWCLTHSQRQGMATLLRTGDARLRHIQAYCDQPTSQVILHNSMHDLGVLEDLGVTVPRFIDTMVLSYLLCLEPQGLKALAYRLAGMSMDSYEEVVGPGREVVWSEWISAALSVADFMPKPDAYLEWDDKKENWRMKQPQTITQRMKRMVGDVEKKGLMIPSNPGGVDIEKRVKSWEDSGAEALLLTIGPVPEPTLSDIPEETAIHYACRDADATNRIFPILWRRVVEDGLEDICRIDHSIIPMVHHMQSQGLYVHRPHMEALNDELTQAMSDKRDEISAMVGVRINPSSPKQTADLLFRALKLKSSKTTSTGQDSTQDKVLEGLRASHPVVPLILDYRELDKARGSFVRVALDKSSSDGRLRCNLRVTRVTSGRIAANKPNLMAIPVRSNIGKRIRQGFVAPEGKVLADWDLDQAEMRGMAHESEDEGLLAIFNDGILDVHTDTASRMFNVPYASVDKNTQRYPAKRTGFGVITGITGHGLVDQMVLGGAKSPDGDDWTESECDDFILRWFEARPGVRRYMDRCRAEARRQGWVADCWGRKRYLPGVWSGIERIREEACRQSHSHKIQAGAQGWMKKAMAMIWWWTTEVWWPRGGKWAEIKWLLQIHDSLLSELPDDLEVWEEVDSVVRMCMSQADQWKVPMSAKGGKALNWGDLKD